MTYKEKLAQLSDIATQKAKIVRAIEDEFQTDGFHKYSAFDYIKAHDEHADAVNNHGDVISKMVKEDRALDEEYV